MREVQVVTKWAATKTRASGNTVIPGWHTAEVCWLAPDGSLQTTFAGGSVPDWALQTARNKAAEHFARLLAAESSNSVSGSDDVPVE